MPGLGSAGSNLIHDAVEMLHIASIYDVF
jgi:hypothetical protein